MPIRITNNIKKESNPRYGRIPKIVVVVILGFADVVITLLLVPSGVKNAQYLSSPSINPSFFSVAVRHNQSSITANALSSVMDASNTQISSTASATTSTGVAPMVPSVTHLNAPDAIKAVYMTSWIASDKTLRERLVTQVLAKHLNTIVLDVKDATSRTIFSVPDVETFIASLHERGIYVIGRLTTFEDPAAAAAHPDWAVKNVSVVENNGVMSTTSTVWKNKGGLAWIDAGATPFWDYMADLGKRSYATGFDELNFDYVRFPSDGDMSRVYYPYSHGKSKAEVINNFFSYLDTTFHPLGIPISADLFGETTTDKDDMGIGQVLENALRHFDYVDPMVYPSHFANGWDGWKNPAEHPYEIIQYSMGHAVNRSKILSKSEGTTTTMKLAELRPWLHAFDLGAKYTPFMVDEQIRATNNVGLNGWLLWNAGNVYNVNSFSEISTTTTARN